MDGRMKESFSKNWRGMALMSMSALTVAVGQLLWKISRGEDLFLLIAGFGAYGVGSMLMVLSFRFGKLSVVHPVQSLSYVFGSVLGYFLLSEALEVRQYFAISMIMLGVALIGGGDHE